jgi:hypothetical protein
MEFRDKKSKSRKSKFEEEEAKHKRMERRKSLDGKKKKRSSELTASLLTSDDRGEPRSFFGDNQSQSNDAYNYRNSECCSVVSSSVNDKEKSAQALVPEDYAWDFVVVLPVGIPEAEDGEEQQLPTLEPSEVCYKSYT